MSSSVTPYANQEKALDMINKSQFASAVKNMTSILYFYLLIPPSPQHVHTPNVRMIWNNYFFKISLECHEGPYAIDTNVQSNPQRRLCQHYTKVS